MNACLRFGPWLLLSLIAANAAAAGLLPEHVAKATQERVANGEYPAVVIGYVDGDKSEVDVFGKLDDGSAPNGDTVFEIGSITKTFTATLLAQAVLAGQTQLDAPVATLLPDFKIPMHGGKQITLEEIGTQHSGLPRLPTNFAPADEANPYADYDVAKLKAFLADYSLTRDPGAEYEYSNLAFGLLGVALAQQAHISYEKLVADRILHPLKMSMSGIEFSDAMRAHLATAHGEDGKPTKNWDITALASAGAIRSSTNDMLRYLQANMHPDNSALGAAMKFAQTPRRDVSQGERIGLAWMTKQSEKSSVIWHNGGTGGYRSFLGFSADGKRGVIVMTNIANGVDDIGMGALIENFPIASSHKKVALDAGTLDDYPGDYKLAEKFLINIARKDDQLYAQATGQGAFPIYSSAKDEFFANVAGISISFTRDAKGKVASLILHQNGDRPAPKLAANEVAAPATTKSIELDSATLAGYVGKYQLAPNMVFDITLKEGQLRAQLTGQSEYAVYASAKDKFFYTVVDAQLEFEHDENGKVHALILHQNGQSQRAARIAP